MRGIQGEITSLIGSHGQTVTLWRSGEAVETQAFLQWVKGSGAQYSYGPLGEENLQKVLYFGQAGEEISALGDWISWKGRQFDIVSAHPVYCGRFVGYWRGVLKERPVACGENVEGGN